MFIYIYYYLGYNNSYKQIININNGDNMTTQTLTDVQWQELESLFPKPEKRGRGKPHTEWRKVVNSILYVLSNRTKWDSLPKEEQFASKSAAHRWFKIWKGNGLLNEILTRLQDLSMLDQEVKMPSTRMRMPKMQPETMSAVSLAMSTL